jgi:cyclic dehypoxanthinyl futalosine synthase
MMFGHIETLAERIETLDRLRRLQDETGGFTAFICWTFQPEHTAMADVPPAGGYEYLKTQAIARLYLDNIPNIQSSWVTQGLKIGQLALFYGANDMGSLMIEENVVASAGTVHYLTLEQIKSAIREAGYIPRQRNVFYQLIDEESGVGSQGSGGRGHESAPARINGETAHGAEKHGTFSRELPLIQS